MGARRRVENLTPHRGWGKGTIGFHRFPLTSDLNRVLRALGFQAERVVGAMGS